MKNWKKCIHLFVSFILVFLFLVQPSSASADEVNQDSGNIYYVKPNGSGDCSSWEYACDLQVALGLTNAGDEVWVAAGTYKPTKSTNRFASFSLRSGVSIYGGFPDEGGAWEDRDWEENVTILSGDIGVSEDNSDNSYHVVIGYYLSATTVLDGFIINGGNANGNDEYQDGGGIYLYYGSCPLLRNLIITGNHAYRNGGGIYSYWSSSPVFNNVKFINNSAEDNGGGIYNDYGSSPLLLQVDFSNNVARNGGGMYNFSSTAPMMLQVSFIENSVSNYGAAMYNDYNVSIELIGSSLLNNSANSKGGGIYSYDYCSSIIINTTFSGNSAYEGGGIYNNNNSRSVIDYSTFSQNTGGAIYNSDSEVSLFNSIIWGNTGGSIIDVGESTSSAKYSDIEGGKEGDGNLNEDPLLGPLDYYGGLTLMHALHEGSVAIDNANPGIYLTTDQRGYVREFDGNGDLDAVADMGSYEYGSYPGEYTLEVTVNGDGNVIIDPSQQSYYYGEVVMLEAEPEVGWSFSSWGGDVLYSRNPLVQPITFNTTITANFIKDEYLLNTMVDPEDCGFIAISPQQTFYYYGDQVSLTPIAIPGWIFDHWSGDVSNNEVPLELTITKTTFIRANFVKEERSLYLPLVLR